jgi:hypothetical protein
MIERQDIIAAAAAEDAIRDAIGSRFSKAMSQYEKGLITAEEFVDTVKVIYVHARFSAL